MKISFPARIFLVAFALRLVLVLLSYDLGIGLDDMFQYDMLARSLVAGNGYRWYAQEDLPLIQPYINLDLSSVDYDPRGVLTSFRPPLYPAFLALIYFFAGVDANRFFAARLAQAVLGAALVPLTYALARRFLPENEKAANISAWVVACYPLLVIYPLALATENLFFVLASGAVLALFKAKENLTVEKTKKGPFVPARLRSLGVVVRYIARERWFIISGILLGLTALTRSVSLVFVGLSVLWIWFGLRDRKRAAVVFMTVALVTLPWMARNTLLHGRLTGIESALGYQLYLGYHPEGSGTFQYPQSLELMTIIDDGLRDAVGQAKAIEFIKADPGRFPYLALRRLGHFFGLERRALTYFYSNNFFGYIPTPLLLTIAAIILAPFVIVSVSAAFGLAIIRWRREILLMTLFIVGYLTPHIVIISEDRFHLALIPFLGILAAQFWTSGLAAFRARWQTRNGRIALLLAGLAVWLLFLNWGLELQRDAGKLAQLLGPNGNQTYFPY